MNKPEKQSPEEVPLPQTLRFVMTMGLIFAILWFAMYALLRARW